MSYFLQNMSEICVNGNRTCPEVEYRMIGWEPQGGAQLPVYIFTSGGGVWPTGFNSSTPDLILCEEMARRGYMAVMAELPQLPILSCDSLSNNSLPYYADQVFSYHGQHDTRSFGVLATACRRSTVNCNTGIALHGHSVGGHLSNLAPQFAVGITALLIWGMGSRQPFGGSCCGLWGKLPGDENSCVCMEGQPVGGEDIPCQYYFATAAFLDRTRRRTIISTTDHECAC
jgi:hypothetical protein